MANARVARGRKSQVLLAEYFQRYGWTGAQSTPASIPGKDITGMPGWSVEAKATAESRLLAALRQATKNAAPGDVPVVVYRPKGHGPERIGEWLVAFRLEDAVELMAKSEGFPAHPDSTDIEGVGS